MQYSNAGQVIPQATLDLRNDVRNSINSAAGMQGGMTPSGAVSPNALGPIIGKINSYLAPPQQAPAPTALDPTMMGQQPTLASLGQQPPMPMQGQVGLGALGQGQMIQDPNSRSWWS